MSLHKHKDDLWVKTEQVIKHWLQERQELLVLYYHLSKTTPFEEDQFDDNIDEVIAKFCQLITDYVSAGHFEVFEKILATSNTANNSLQPAQELFRQILDTTEKLMAFSEKYAKNQSNELLQQDLSTFGEQIAKRMDLEDRLIKLYLDHKKLDQVINN